MGFGIITSATTAFISCRGASGLNARGATRIDGANVGVKVGLKTVDVYAMVGVDDTDSIEATKSGKIKPQLNPN